MSLGKKNTFWETYNKNLVLLQDLNPPHGNRLSALTAKPYVHIMLRRNCYACCNCVLRTLKFLYVYRKIFLLYAVSASYQYVANRNFVPHASLNFRDTTRLVAKFNTALCFLTKTRK